MRIALPATIDAHAIATRDPHAPIVDLAGETMGTRWTVRLAAPPRFDPAAARTAIVVRLAGLVDEMSHWLPTSHLCRFNRAAAGSWHTLPPDFAHVIAAALRIAQASGGAFDPAIGRLIDLAGFGPAPGPMLGEDDFDTAGAAAGWHRLAYDAPARRLLQPGGLALDLSGIAKGHAVDAVADLLRDRGVQHALVEIGGELAGRGVRPDGEPWWVELETPPGIALPSFRVALHGLTVATSGDYRRGGHTLDPRTGRSTTNGVVSVSVLHPSAMMADAWATALTVAGPEHGAALAARHDLAARIVTRTGDAMQEHCSPALLAMLADD